MGLRPLEIFSPLQCGDRLYLSESDVYILYLSESDVYRRQILTNKVYPRAVRVNLDTFSIRLDKLYNKIFFENHGMLGVVLIFLK